MNNFANFLRLDYEQTAGPKQQDKPAKEYVLKLYLAANPDPDRQCYSHFTTATGCYLRVVLFCRTFINAH